MTSSAPTSAVTSDGAPARRLRRGPVYMVLASLLFTIMIGTVKVARQEMSPFAIMFWRAAFSLPLSLAFAWPRGLSITNRGGMLLRALFGFGAMACFFTAARGLTLADLTIISKLQPILVALSAPLALGAAERAHRNVWIVLGAGLAGTALIVGPDLRVGSLAGLWALAATGLSAGAHLAVRALGRTDDPYGIVFWFQVMVLLSSWAIHMGSTGTGWPLPPSDLWPHLVVCGLTSTGGQFLMTHAYRVDWAAPVAAASYSAPLFGVVGDLVVFAAIPGATAIIGGLLIVGGGLALVLSQPPSAPPQGRQPAVDPGSP